MTWLTRMHLRTWQHQMTTIMQPFQCDLQPQIQETHRTTHKGTTTRCRTQRRNRLNSKRSKPHPPHTRGTFHRRLKPLYTEKYKVSCSGFLPKRKPMQHSCSHYNAFCSMTWLTRMHLRTWQHQMTTIMQPFQCDLQPQIQETHRTTHKGTTTRCRTQRRNRLNSKRSKPHPPHTRGTFHRRLKPRYTQGFVLRLPPQKKAHATFMQPFQCVLQHDVANPHASTHMATRDGNNHAAIPMRSEQPQIQETHRTTHTGTTTRCRTQRRNRLNSKRSKPHPPTRFRAPASSPTHHLPSSPLPFFTTSLPHHFPSSLFPFLTTSLPHHSPSSSLPFFTTSLPHHFPSSPLPFLTTSLPHHFPSSPLPIITTSHRHHFPSSPRPFLTTSLPHHFPSSPLPIVTTSLHHHPVIVSNLHQGQFHRFLFFGSVLICYVLLYDLPPFIISNLRILFVRTTLYYKACTKHFPVLLCTTKLAQTTSQYYFVLQSLHKEFHPSTTLYCKACTNYFTALLCTTKLAQTTSQYYFVLQSLHKLLPSTTFYYKACTNYFPVLLCSTKLAKSVSQYFVLQSLHKYFPLLLCTTKLAQTTSQYYFVLQSLHKEFHPSTTLYCKPCRKYFPGLHCDTKLAQRKLLHTASSFAEKLLHTASFLNKLAQRKHLHTAYSFAEKLLHTASFSSRETLTHRSFYTQQAFSQRSFYTQQVFTHSKRLHTEHLHTVFLHMASIYTHRNFCTEALLHTEAFTHSKFLNTKSFTHSGKLLQKNVFTQRSSLEAKTTILKHFLKGFLKGKLLAPKLRKSADKSLSQPWCSHSNTIYEIQLQKTINSITHAAAARSNLDAAITMRSAETELQDTIELRAAASEIAAPKPDGSRRQSKKKTILKHFLKGFLKGKLLAPKLRKSTDKSLSQPGCSHSNTIYDV